MNRRKFIGIGGLVGLGVPLTADRMFSAKVSAKSAVKVYEYTFLKSLDAKPDDLIHFLTANWLAMDKIAVEKNLMVNFAVYEASADDAESWNVAVAVGYPTENGYEAIKDEFEKIRKNHRKVLIGGKDLKELGAIVGSRKFYPRVVSKN